MQDADMNELPLRLRQARIRAGYKSAAEAARRLAMPYGTYSGHENGNRGFKTEDLIKYSRVFNVSLSWLIDGIGEPEPSDSIENAFIQMIGSVGTLPNGEVELSSPDKSHPVVRMDYFPEDSAIVRVSGSTARNFVRSGWHLICEDRFYEIEDRHQGEICFCLTEDERIFLVRIVRIDVDKLCDVEDANGDILFRRKFKGAAVVGLILPTVAVKGMYDLMQTHSDQFAELTQEMDRTGDQSLTISINISEHKLRWGRTSASRPIR